MLKNRVLLMLTAMAALLVPASAQEVKRGGENLLHRAQVEYPAEAIGNKIEGTVVLEARLDEKGIVRDARVISGPDVLRAAALRSVLDWHYSVENGLAPVVEIEIEFKLTKDRINVVSAPPMAGTLKSIEFVAVDGELKDKVLAKLALKVGDNISADSHTQIVQAVRDVDEHLQVRILTNAGSTRIQVSMPEPYRVPPPASQYERPMRIRVGSVEQATKILHKVTPTYPAEAKQAEIQGAVRFNAIISKEGLITNLQLVMGHRLLAPSAMDAVKQWVYSPTLLNGEPVEVQAQIDVYFTLTGTPTVQTP